VKLDLTPGAALTLGLAVWLCAPRELAALALAAAAHEAGHLLALRLCRARLRRVRVTAFGPELDWRGALTDAQTLLCVGGGPLLGLVWAIFACALGGETLLLSGALSLLLTAFNLLPVPPLDGGRLLALRRGEAAARRVGRALSPALLAAGAWLLWCVHAPGLLLAGAWLTVRSWGR